MYLAAGTSTPRSMTRQALPLEHHFDEVLADVVPVALDGAEHDGAAHLAAAFREQGLEQLKSRVHRARGDHDLGDIDLVRLELLPDDPHACKQAAVQDFPGGKALRDRAGNRFFDGGARPCCRSRLISSKSWDNRFSPLKCQKQARIPIFRYSNHTLLWR